MPSALCTACTALLTQPICGTLWQCSARTVQRPRMCTAWPGSIERAQLVACRHGHRSLMTGSLCTRRMTCRLVVLQAIARTWYSFSSKRGPHSVSCTEAAPRGCSNVWCRKEMKSARLAIVTTRLLSSWRAPPPSQGLSKVPYISGRVQTSCTSTITTVHATCTRVHVHSPAHPTCLCARTVMWVMSGADGTRKDIQNLAAARCAAAGAAHLGAGEEVFEDVADALAQRAGEVVQHEVRVRLGHRAHLPLLADVVPQHLAKAPITEPGCTATRSAQAASRCAPLPQQTS